MKGTGRLLVIGIHTCGAAGRAAGGQAGGDRGGRSRRGRWTWLCTATTSACGRPRPPTTPTCCSTWLRKVVVLVDDVLYTGRTVRAALDALTDFGGRGPSSWPCWSTAATEPLLRADYVGKNLPTAVDQAVRVLLTETDGEDGVVAEDAPRKAVAS